MDGVIYEGMRHYMSTGTGFHVTFVRREMSKHHVGGGVDEDVGDDPILHDTIMGARPTLGRCVGKLSKPQVKHMPDLKGCIVDRNRKQF